MFLKLNKKFLAVAVFTCSSAMLCAQEAQSSKELDIRRDISIEEIVHDARYVKAESFVTKAKEDYLNSNYESAIENYMQAWKAYEEIGQSELLSDKIKFCQAQIGECYKLYAQSLAQEAERESVAEQYDKAIALAKKAAEVSPDMKEQMDKAIERYNFEKKAIERRNQVTEELVIPNLKADNDKIARLLAQADNLYRNNKIIEAKAKYNEVLTIQNTNTKALRGVKVCNMKLYDAGERRANTTGQRMIAEAANGYVVPIRSAKETASKAHIGNTPVAKSVAMSSELVNKLKDIRIPEISISGEHLPDAINLVMDEARVNDPSGEGVNIICIWPEDIQVDQNGIPIDTGAYSQDNNNFYRNNTRNQRNNNRNRNNNNNNRNQRNNQQRGVPMNAEQQMAMMMMGGGMAPAAGGGMPMGGYNNANEEIDENDLKYPKIALNLSNATLDEIIERICRQAQLKYKVDNNAVIIAPIFVPIGDMEIKLFPLKREALLATDFHNPDQLMIFFASHGILFPRGSTIVYDWRSSRLIVKNTAENLDKIEELIQTQMSMKDVQVKIEAKFIEVTQNDMQELGFDYTLSRTPEGGTNGQLEFSQNDSIMNHLNNGSDRVFTFQRSQDGYNFSGSVYALDWSDSKDVMFAPRVPTLNGETAIIKMVRRVYFPDDYNESTQTTTQSDYANAQAYSYISPIPNFDGDPTEIGIQLMVKPEVDLKRRTITLRMTPMVRQFIGWSTYEYVLSGSAFPADEFGNQPMEILREPAFAERLIDTLVTARDGETIVLGGIVKDQTSVIEDKVPILGDIPLIGRFFRSNSEDSQKVNMLIFMTCSLVNPDGSPFFPDSVKPTGVPTFTEAI